MRFFVTILAILVFSSGTLFADDEQSTYAYISAGHGGRAYFKMVPDPKKHYTHKAGTGTMYVLQRDGSSKKLWSLSGWYAFRTYPSHWGRYLVRLGNWPRGRTISDKHLAIAFYDRGKLIKRYSTKDLIKHPTRIQPSVGHYRYLRKAIGFIGYSKRFVLVTWDNMRYDFDVRSGKIVSVKELQK